MQLPNKTVGVGAGGTVIGAILASVIAVEGGYVNDPDDLGGETNYGITIAVARANGYFGDMKDLTKERAKNIYLSNYVYRPNFDQVLEQSKAVGTKLIDAGVNVGTYRPVCWLQDSINALNANYADVPQINVDCYIGKQTMSAYTALVQKRGAVKSCELLLKLIDARQTQHYLNLKQHKFTVGWVDHRIGNVPLSECTYGTD